MALGHRALRGLALVQRRFQVEVAMMGKGTLQLGVLLPWARRCRLVLFPQTCSPSPKSSSCQDMVAGIPTVT